MSGSNRGTFKAGTGDVNTVLGAGCWSGRSMSYKKGPGVPPKKSKRSFWYAGGPVVALPNGATKSRKYSFKKKLRLES